MQAADYLNDGCNLPLKNLKLEKKGLICDIKDSLIQEKCKNWQMKLKNSKNQKENVSQKKAQKGKW